MQSPSNRPLTKTEAAAFHRRVTYREDRLVIWCITTNTTDFGNRFVARPIKVPNPHPDSSDGYLIADKLDEIRNMLPEGLVRLNRHKDDDPVIVETWF